MLLAIFEAAIIVALAAFPPEQPGTTAILTGNAQTTAATLLRSSQPRSGRLVSPSLRFHSPIPTIAGTGFETVTKTRYGDSLHAEPLVSMSRMTSLDTRPSPRAPVIPPDDDFIFGPPSPTRSSSDNRGGPGISFGGAGPTVPPLSPVITSQGCKNCSDAEACFKSQCHRLLYQGPCATGERLIVKNNRPECSQSRCQYPNLFHEGNCVRKNILEQTICKPTQELIFSRDGQFQCHCRLGNVYHPQTNNCYKPYTRGPCEASQYLISKMDPQSTDFKAECVANPCRDGMVCYGVRCSQQGGKCVSLNTVCKKRNGETGYLDVDYYTHSIDCTNQTPPLRNIGDVPTFACPKGSKRDVSGKCRKVSNVQFS